MSEQAENLPQTSEGFQNGAAKINSVTEALSTAPESGPQAPAAAPAAADGAQTGDVQMTDASSDKPTQLPLSETQPPATTAASTAPADPSPQPAQSQQQQPPQPQTAPPPRTTTPMRDAPHTSRSASAHPDPAPTQGQGAQAGPAMPTEAAAHGAPVRRYINSKVTGVLLEGMKVVGKEQPKDPLRVLGEFFLQRSREIEGTGPSS